MGRGASALMVMARVLAVAPPMDGGGTAPGAASPLTRPAAVWAACSIVVWIASARRQQLSHWASSCATLVAASVAAVVAVAICALAWATAMGCAETRAADRAVSDACALARAARAACSCCQTTSASARSWVMACCCVVIVEANVFRATVMSAKTPPAVSSRGGYCETRERNRSPSDPIHDGAMVEATRDRSW